MRINKQKALYELIKSEFIDKAIEQDLKEKTKYAKQIINVCKKDYGFKDEVIIRIFRRIYYNTDRISNINTNDKNFMLGMANVWNNNNIKTSKDIKQFYDKLEAYIVNIIGRDLETTEKIEIENLIYNNKNL